MMDVAEMTVTRRLCSVCVLDMLMCKRVDTDRMCVQQGLWLSLMALLLLLLFEKGGQQLLLLLCSVVST